MRTRAWVTDSCLFVILLDLDFLQGKTPKAFHIDHEFKLLLKDKLVFKFTLQQVKQQNKVRDNNLCS